MNLKLNIYKTEGLRLKTEGLLFLLFFVMLGFLLEAESIAQNLPVPTQYVEDKAGIIDHAIKEKLNAYLKELEQKTGVQAVVLTVRSTEGMPIEQFAFNLASKWKLGQKGKDNGLLIVIAKEDRAYRFEVGYGLESILPDSLCGSIGRELLVPNFRKGDYGKGIFEAVIAIINKIVKEYRVEIGEISKREYSERDQISSPWWDVFSIILAFLVIIGVITGLSCLYDYCTGGDGWSGLYYSGGFGGGGFSGGGGGGFGGGGGGSFGGGGASGRW